MSDINQILNSMNSYGSNSASYPHSGMNAGNTASTNWMGQNSLGMSDGSLWGNTTSNLGMGAGNDFMGMNANKSGLNGLNLDSVGGLEGITTGIGAVTDIGGMIMNGLKFKAGKDMMNFNQDLAKNNLHASIKSYNNQVNDRERSRLASQGRDRYEQISGGTLDQNIAKKNVTATI